MGREIGVLVAQGLNVPKFLKDVSNLVKNVPRVPKSISRWETTSNHFLLVPKWSNGPWEGT